MNQKEKRWEFVPNSEINVDGRISRAATIDDAPLGSSPRVRGTPFAYYRKNRLAQFTP